MTEKEPSSIRQNIGMADTLTSWADLKNFFGKVGERKKIQKENSGNMLNERNRHTDRHEKMYIEK